MSKKLHVNTDELKMTADRLDMHAADLGHGHAVAHTSLASAVPGFGASLSAAALRERIAQWELETAEHQAELGRHGEGHRAAVAGYTSTDSDSSEVIASVWGNVSGSRELNL